MIIDYSSKIGHGINMVGPDFGYDYFRRYVRTESPTTITDTYTTSDFNSLGINRVVHEISRSSDLSTAHFFAGNVEVITVTGTRRDVGQFDDTDMEMIMDRSVSWSASDWTVLGTTFGDKLISYVEDDTTMYGESGDDTLTGGWGRDTLYGGNGADQITAGSERQASFTKDMDKLYGGAGADILRGGEDADSLFGDGENDKLFGGLGNDTMSGGTGADTFHFQHYGGTDRITDFAADRDVLVFGSGIKASSLRLTETADGVRVKAGYGLTIILEGADLTTITVEHPFLF